MLSVYLFEVLVLPVVAVALFTAEQAVLEASVAVVVVAAATLGTVAPSLWAIYRTTPRPNTSRNTSERREPSHERTFPRTAPRVSSATLRL